MIKLQIINNFDNCIELSNELTVKIISSILSNESKYDRSSMSIIIVDDEYLRNLKIKYFDMDILTDVITFNLSDDNKDLDAEIYISWDRINDHAVEYEETINEEVKRVIIHGCLHLVGFNDSTEEEIKEMRNKEQEYLSQFNEEIII